MKYVLVLFLFILTPVISAQGILQEYITLGLESNLALKQKESGYKVSLEALKEARGMFYPSVTLNARYTVSEGGRAIYFPVGDLMNPVYETLNQLTGSNMFPPVENQQILFLRPTEHETKVRMVQPVLNTDVYYNAKIRKELVVTEGTGIDQYKRELIYEIKKAYYDVGMTVSLVEMLKETRLLLLENIRVNTRLYENSKVTKDYLLRSQTELSKLDQQMQLALKNKQVAGAYFNFLLNRSLSDSIIVEAPVVSEMPEQSQDYFTRQAIETREEIRNLENYSDISDLSTKMYRSSGLPSVFLLADYGYQGENYEFNKDQDYMQASLVMTWDLFNGLQNRSKIRQSLVQKEIIEHKLDEVRSQVELQVITVMSELRATEAAIRAAEDQAKSAREGFRLVNRKYGEGQASLVEFLDARSAMTQADASLIVLRYTHLSNLAEFEKTISGYQQQ
jgi:outer membrane protein TolC